MALYRHLAAGVTPGEIFNFSLWSNGNLSIGDAQAAWDLALTTFWSTAVAGLFANEVAITSTSTAEVDVATGLQSVRVDSAVSLPGTSTAEMLPFQCATAVSLRTIFATRRGRGRFFLPPVTVAAIASGRLLTTAQTTLADAAQSMMTVLAGQGQTPVVYSRASRAAITITGIDVGNVIDTQRRRRNKLVEVRISRPV